MGLSNQAGTGESLTAVLQFTQRWTAAINWSTFEAANADLTASNAYLDPGIADNTGQRLQLPRLAPLRLLEIGEAVKALPADLLAAQPQIPWRQITRMRDHLAHRYFDTAHAILQATVDEDLPPLGQAVTELIRSLPDYPPASQNPA